MISSASSSAMNNAKNDDSTHMYLYFLLERQLLLFLGGREFYGDDADNGTKPRDPLDVTTLSPDVRLYVDLDLPPLCRRYADLPLSPNGWLVELLAGRDEELLHKESHCRLAKFVARNYKMADEETKGFVKDVVERLAVFWNEFKAAKERGRERGKEGEDERERERKKWMKLVEEAAMRKFRDDINVNWLGDISHSISHSSMDPYKKATMSYLHPTSRFPIDTPLDIELERLRLDLALAVSSRIESERKVCVLRSELEAAVERNRECERESWTRLGEEARIPPQIFLKGATRNIGHDSDIDWLGDISQSNMDPYKMDLNSHSNIKNAELERLRLELALAESSRVESERKVCVLKSELDDYHARQLDQGLPQRRQDGQHQYLHQEHHEQQQQRHHQQEERSRDDLPSNKRLRRSGTNEYKINDTAVIGERVDDHLASPFSALMSIPTPYGQQPMPPAPPQPQAGHEDSTSGNTGEASETTPPQQQQQQQQQQQHQQYIQQMVAYGVVPQGGYPGYYYGQMQALGCACPPPPGADGYQGPPPENLHHTQMQVLQGGACAYGPQRMYAPPYQPHMMYPQHLGIPSLGAAAAASLMCGGRPPYYGWGWPGMGCGAGYPQHGGGGNPDQNAYRDRNSNMQGGGRVTAFEQTALADSLVTSRQDTKPFLASGPGQVNTDPSVSSSSSSSTSSPETVASKQPALSNDPFRASGPGQMNTDDHSALSSSSLSTSSPTTVAFKQPALSDYPFMASGPGQMNTDDHSASSSSSLSTSSPKTVAFKKPALVDSLAARLAKSKAQADSLVASRLTNGKALADSLVASRLATAADIRQMGLHTATLRGMSW